jgi:type VI secretion system secreted protein VgrG
MGIETERELEFHCPLGPDVLMVRHFAGAEYLGGNFEYVVTLYSDDQNVKLESLLGKHATVAVKFDPSQPRYFDGIVSEFSHQGTEADSALYRVVLRPWLWLLSRNRDCRIYQNQTTLEIAQQIFKERGFSDTDVHLFMGLTTREYCVQYNESDFDFISRLFEYEGIYYFFKHELGKHTMVLADSLSAHDPAPGFETLSYAKTSGSGRSEGAFYDWTATKQVLPGKVNLNDFDFKKSRANLAVGRADAKPHEHAESEVYLYPGRYHEVGPGMDNAIVRLEEASMPHDLARGVTDCRGLFAGALFTLQEHPRDDQNKEYLVVSAHYDIDSGPYRSGGASALRMTTHLTALDSKVQYRPARVTPIPSVSGPQTARVVGPKASEIWTDEFGRVKVQFAWDHLGKFDENSSCFVRVSQTWAGAEWGSIHIPRIGQEVLVDFIDGDLDRPIIIGRVYNDYNKPPYGLPKNATQSGIKSHTVEGGRDDYNELRFEDAKAKEEIVLRAQRNLTTRVRNDSSTTIGNNHTHTVSKNMKVLVQEGDYNSTVSKGTMLSYVPENVYDVCAKEIVETADDSITFQVKDVSIRIDAKSISLNVGTTTEIKLELATLKIISPKVDINPMGGAPGGPASVASLAKAAGAASKEKKTDFKGGGGDFGGGGASGDW